MSEHGNPVGLHRRETDQPGDDFRDKRRYEEREVIIQQGIEKAHWKIYAATLSLLGTLGISILTYLGMRDRKSIDDEFTNQGNRITVQEQTTARHEADLAVLKTSGVRQAEDTAETRRLIEKLNERIEKLDDKFDRVLAEVRKQR